MTPAEKRAARGIPKPLPWTWDDRGRSAVTEESVRADLARLAALVDRIMRSVHYQTNARVVVGSQGWR